MKTSYFKKILLCLFLPGTLFLASCIDKSIDLDNVSEEMLVGGKVPLPVLKESRLSVYNLLERYNADDTHGVLLDTIGGDICLLYNDTFTYSVNQINYDFDVFTGGMMNQNMGITDIFKGTPIVDLLNMTGNIVLTDNREVLTTMDYDMNTYYDEGENANKQKLESILFRNAKIVVTIVPTFEIQTTGVLKLQIKIPGMDEPLPEIAIEDGKDDYPFEYDDFIVEAKGNVEVKFIVTGDDKTRVGASDKITSSIRFESRDESQDLNYIAYGYFNYVFDDNARNIKVDTFVANLYNYVPEAEKTKLYMEDPQFNFEVSSNLGVPLQFNLNTIQSEVQSGDGETFFSTHAPFHIQRVDEPGKTILTDNIEKVDASFFRDYGNPAQKFSDYINTELNSLEFSYRFASDPIDLDNIQDIPLQFIPSDGKIEMYGKLRVPLFFDERSEIHYQDTIDIDFDTESLEDVSSVELRFAYTNHLPIGFYLDLYLLDESYRNIPDTKAPYQNVEIERAGVYESGDRKGEVDESKLAQGEFSFKFTTDSDQSITKLQEAKYLRINYRSIKDEVKKPIKLKTNDYLSLRLNATIDGKIILNNE